MTKQWLQRYACVFLAANASSVTAQSDRTVPHLIDYPSFASAVANISVDHDPYLRPAQPQHAVVRYEIRKNVLNRINSTEFCSTLCAGSNATTPSGLFHNAMVFGRDSRINGAYLTPENFAKFTAVGRVECPDPDAAGKVYATTGFVVQQADTLVAVSHAFYDAPNPPLRPKELRIDPKTCVFATYDIRGQLKDYAYVERAQIRWDKPALHGDATNDFALVKLSRSLNHVVFGPGMGNGHKLNGSPIKLIAFHNDVPDPRVMRSTEGQIFPMPFETWKKWNDASPHNVSNYRKMFITNVDANHGASGGIFVDPVTGLAIGIHLGAISPGGVEVGEFDPTNAYNFGVYFDEQLVADIKAFIKGEEAVKLPANKQRGAGNHSAKQHRH